MVTENAQEWLHELGGPQNISDTLDTLRQLTPDRWHVLIVEIFEEKLQLGKPFWELCCALNLFARRRAPAKYLEIGVRRGKSMAQVACNSHDCDITGFDAWISPYAHVENPGPDFVAWEMQRLGHRGNLELISGDTQKTLPQFLRNHPDDLFDLATIDGDHSEEGAMRDLRNVAPRIASGGLLLFDDLTNPNCPLAGVWKHFQEECHADFVFYQNLDDHQGTGIAIRNPF